MTTSVSIGIDIGHSSVKVSVKIAGKPDLSGASFNFPTVVSGWKLISNDLTAQKALRDTVSVGAKRYFIGETAIRQGQADSFSGQSRDWVNSEEHDALLIGAWSRAVSVLHENGVVNPANIALVVGLPTSYYLEQRPGLRARVFNLIQSRLAPGQKLSVHVEAQSRAPLLCEALDFDGHATGRAGENESWGVVEIGHFTTDFTFHDKGQEIDGLSGSVSGVRMAYDLIAGKFKQGNYPVDIESIDVAIRTKKTKMYGAEVDVSSIVNPAIEEFASYILNEVAARFGDKAPRMDGIIIAGGGAHIVGGMIAEKYPNAKIYPNPRHIVAEGYARLGLLALEK